MNDRYNYRVIDHIEELIEFLDSDAIDLSVFDSSSLFLSDEFITTWLECYSAYIHELVFIVFYNGTAVIGVAPLYIKKEKRTEIRFLCTGENEEEEICAESIDVLVDMGNRDVVMHMLMDYLITNQFRWNKFIIDNYVKGSFIADNLLPFLSGKKYPMVNDVTGIRYFLDLPATIEAFYKDKKGSFYNGLRRKYRKLVKTSDISYDVITGSECLDEYMLSMKELHNYRWNSSGIRGVFESDVFFNFHKILSHKLANKNRLFLLVIKDTKHIFSVVYGYIFKGVLYFYQSGYSISEYQNLSIGSVSHLIAIEYAIDRKLSVYDFMLGSGDSYKNRFKCDTEKMYQCEIYRPGIRGKLKMFFDKIHCCIN